MKYGLIIISFLLALLLVSLTVITRGTEDNCNYVGEVKQVDSYSPATYGHSTPEYYFTLTNEQQIYAKDGIRALARMKSGDKIYLCESNILHNTYYKIKGE